jgi:hypothetical protein
MPFLCIFTKKWRKKGNQRAECPLETRKTFRLGISAARGSFAASDAVKAYMFFSPALFAERQRSGFQRPQAFGSFLGYFLSSDKK